MATAVSSRSTTAMAVVLSGAWQRGLVRAFPGHRSRPGDFPSLECRESFRDGSTVGEASGSVCRKCLIFWGGRRLSG